MRPSEGLGLTLATPVRKWPSRPTAWPNGVWTAAASVKFARRVPFRAVLFHRRRQTCCTRRARALFQLSQLLPSPKRRRSPPPRTEPRLCRPRQISSQVSWVAVVNDPFARRNSARSSTAQEQLLAAATRAVRPPGRAEVTRKRPIRQNFYDLSRTAIKRCSAPRGALGVSETNNNCAFSVVTKRPTGILFSELLQNGKSCCLP